MRRSRFARRTNRQRNALLTIERGFFYSCFATFFSLMLIRHELECVRFALTRYLSENALRFLTGISKKKMAKTRLKRTLPQAIEALNKLLTIKTSKQ